MTEWGVVGVIIALVGLGAAIIKPIISLNTAITKLTMAVNELQKDIADITTRNTSSHDRLWKKNGEQDATLDDHEHRITVLEERWP